MSEENMHQRAKLLTDQELADVLRTLAQSATVYERVLLREAAQRILDMRSVLDSDEEPSLAQPVRIDPHSVPHEGYVWVEGPLAQGSQEERGLRLAL
jgi:hypothetical protein